VFVVQDDDTVSAEGAVDVAGGEEAAGFEAFEAND
jgi:hypothetical protein